MSDETQKVNDWVTDGTRIAQINVLTIYEPNKHLHSKIIALDNPKYNLPSIDYSHPIEKDGVIKTLQEWSDHFKIDRSKVRYRLSRGMSFDAAFSSGDFRRVS